MLVVPVCTLFRTAALAEKLHAKHVTERAKAIRKLMFKTSQTPIWGLYITF
jgi:hypothetical protein